MIPSQLKLLDMKSMVEELAKNASKMINRGDIPFVEKKNRMDLVTEIDIQVEEYLKDGLNQIWPECKFLGEESNYSDSSNIKENGNKNGIDVNNINKLNDHPTWIVDPIDGTTNLIHQYPMYCISIALVIDRVPRLGVIYNPSLGEMYSAIEGCGATLNGNPIFIKSLPLSNSLIMTEFGPDPSSHAYKLEQCKEMLKVIHAIRMTGSAALNLCMVARGASQGYWEDGIKSWDIAAGIAIIKEAGGYICDYPLDSGKCIVACTEKVANQMREIIMKGKEIVMN